MVPLLRDGSLLPVHAKHGAAMTGRGPREMREHERRVRGQFDAS
jgi:hypothetical protein